MQLVVAASAAWPIEASKQTTSNRDYYYNYNYNYYYYYYYYYN